MAAPLSVKTRYWDILLADRLFWDTIPGDSTIKDGANLANV